MYFPTDPILISDVISRIFTWISTVEGAAPQPVSFSTPPPCL